MSNNCYLEIIRPGINSTFQDKGRFGLHHFGIPVSGAMDYRSYLISNALVKNDFKVGVLEFAYQGPLIKLHNGNANFCITGNVIFKIIKKNKDIIEGICNKNYFIEDQDQIDILTTKKSVFGYLSFEGGFVLEKSWNSISTNTKAKIGSNDGDKLNNGDKIFLKKNNIENFKARYLKIDYKEGNEIRVLIGPNYDYFSKDSQDRFFREDFLITKLTDRMGMRLKGFGLSNIKSTNIRSEGMIKGVIQVPPDGHPIIMLSDYGTIGGYPKIANVASADYDKLAQKIPNTKIKFKCIDLLEAEKLYKNYQQDITKIINNI